jgi:hypothetical protein
LCDRETTRKEGIWKRKKNLGWLQEKIRMNVKKLVVRVGVGWI